jgi:hypothetical protein
VRIGQKSGIENNISVDRQSVLEPETQHRGTKSHIGVICECRLNLAPKIVNVKSAGVNDEIGGLSHVSQNLALSSDAVDESLARLQRMRSAITLKPLHENSVVSLEEKDSQIDPTRLAEVIQTGSKRFKEATCANIHYNCKSRNLGSLQDGTHHLLQEHRRQVVDYEPALILKGSGGRRSSGARHTSHHEDL